MIVSLKYETMSKNGKHVRQTCNSMRVLWVGKLMMGKFTVWSSAMMKTPSSVSEKMARWVSGSKHTIFFEESCNRNSWDEVFFTPSQFIQWNIHRCGVKQSEQALAQDATGPFILSGYSGYKQVSLAHFNSSQFYRTESDLVWKSYIHFNNTLSYAFLFRFRFLEVDSLPLILKGNMFWCVPAVGGSFNE